MSRAVIMAALAAVLALVGLPVIYFVIAPAPERRPLTVQEQGRHTEHLVDVDPDRSVRGGQEMKPRW